MPQVRHSLILPLVLLVKLPLSQEREVHGVGKKKKEAKGCVVAVLKEWGP